MTDHGSRGKANTAFPPLPQSLEIAGRFPLSHTTAAVALPSFPTKAKSKIPKPNSCAISCFQEAVQFGKVSPNPPV
jgi:hypothetical protein